MESDEGPYYAYNVLTVADVLDREASVIKWSLNSRAKKIEPVIAEEIIHHVFYADRVEPLAIFRIPERPLDYYVTDRFVERVERFDLRGMRLPKVWPIPKPYKSSYLEMMRMVEEKLAAKREAPPGGENGPV